MLKLIFILLFFVNSSFALNNVDKAQLPGINIIPNPGFENGKANWTASGGTFATTTTAPRIGAVHATWDSNGAAQNLSSTAVAMPYAYGTTNGEAYCYFRTPSGTATHKLQVLEDVTVVGEVSIVSTQDSAKVSVVFPFSGAAGNMTLRILSVAADEPSIQIDGCYLGPAVSVGTGAIITDWNVDTSTITIGATTTPPTKASGINVDRLLYRRVGSNLELRLEYSQSNATSAAVGSGDYLFPAIPTALAGLTIDTTKATVYATVEGGSSNFQSRGAVGSGTVGFAADNGSFSVFVYDTTRVRFCGVTPTTAGCVGSAYFHTNDTATSWAFTYSVPISGWVGTGTTYTTDQSDYGPTSYTPTFGAGFGTVTSPVVTYSKTGSMLKVMGTATAGTTASNIYSITLPTGLSIDTTKITIGNTSANPGQVIGSFAASGTTNARGAIVTATGTSASTVYFAGWGSSATTATPFSSGTGLVTNSTSFTFEFEVPISGWATTNRAPQLVNSVLNTSSGVTRTEAAEINCDAGSAISRQHGNWIASVGNVSTGSCLVTFVTGTFSAAPYCDIQAINTVPQSLVSVHTHAAASVTIDCANTAGTACSGFDSILKCTGAK